MAADVLQDLAKHVITPIVRETDSERARRVVDALRAAGFRVFEITLTVPDAFRLVHELAADDDLVVGVGTVLTGDDARRGIDAGARFVVSPIASAEVAAATREAGAAAILGALTPTEIKTAQRAGADAIKIFPADSVGGPKHLKAIVNVFPDLALIPTGGVDLETLRPHLDAGAHSVGVGGALTRGDGRTIEATGRRYLDAARELRPTTTNPTR